jgi:hypothetical protein
MKTGFTSRNRGHGAGGTLGILLIAPPRSSHSLVRFVFFRVFVIRRISRFRRLSRFRASSRQVFEAEEF